MSAGVLAGGWFGAGTHRVQMRQWWTLADLAGVAEEAGATVVYVVDATWHALDDRTPVTVTGDGAPPWRVRAANGVSIVFVEHDAGRVAGPWHNLDAAELLAAFGAFERFVGVPWSDSIGHTAERLIASTHPRARGGTLLDQSPEIPEPCRQGSLEVAWQAWRRQPFDAERRADYVHVFDANAQYLAAWISVEVGHGTPEHRRRPSFDPKLAGVWRLARPPAPAMPGLESLPPAAIPEREWFTTPTVARLAEIEGEAPVIEEAFVWPRKSRFFRAAGERLRDARAAAMSALDESRDYAWTPDTGESDALAYVRRIVTAGAVLDAVKDVYRVETGRLNMDRDPRSGWARPDWGHTIRATARVNLHRRLARLGAFPFAIATDGLMFATSNPDPVDFARTIGLPLGVALGQFKHAGSSPAAPVWRTFDDERGVLPLLRAVYEHRREGIAA